MRASPPWAALRRTDAPTLLVLGDYYIFGEIDEHAGINRLVREYGINSREDLDAWLMDNPKAMGSYRDLDLYSRATANGAKVLSIRVTHLPYVLLTACGYVMRNVTHSTPFV